MAKHRAETASFKVSNDELADLLEVAASVLRVDHELHLDLPHSTLESKTELAPLKPYRLGFH